MAKKKTKPNVGDVFRVPLSEGRSGFGQIIAQFEKEMLLIVMYSLEVDNDEIPGVVDIVASEPLLIANSMDAKIWHGDWPIVENVPPNLERIPLPKYKVGVGAVPEVVSYDGLQRRRATEAELRVLSFRSCFSPQVLEDALKDHFGYLQTNEFKPAELERLRAEFPMLKAELALQAARVRM